MLIRVGFAKLIWRDQVDVNLVKYNNIKEINSNRYIYS